MNKSSSFSFKFQCFDNCQGVNVPRSRFLPVKTCQDLLLIMSNLYSLNNGTLSMSPERMFQTTPLIKLGALHFQKVIQNVYVHSKKDIIVSSYKRNYP